MQPTVKISGLPPQSDPTVADKIPIVSGGQTDYTTISSLIDLIFDNIPSTVSLLTGWANLGYDPDTVTYLGNRSYQLVFNNVDLTNVLAMGQRLRLQNLTPGATQCADFEASSSQYYSKSSPAGMTFTDDFVTGGWIKVESYGLGMIASRFNGTSGWMLYLESDGRLTLAGVNGGAGNVSQVSSYQAVPLNTWVHVAAQLDMSAFTATSTTSYTMFDGVNVPAVVSRSGTNPTALAQAGNLEIGSRNGGSNYFDGKQSNWFVSSGKITQANVRTLYSQTITSDLISSLSIASAYSFNNSINDLNTTNANNLTANNSIVATNADCFRGYQSDETISEYFDYAIISAPPAFSTNTTVTVQVPEGCAISTSNTFSAVSYSTSNVPYRFPSKKSKWQIVTLIKSDFIQNSPSTGVWYNLTSSSGVAGGVAILLPIGDWEGGYETAALCVNGTAVPNIYATLSTNSSTETDSITTAIAQVSVVGSTPIATLKRETNLALTAATTYYLNHKTGQAAATNIQMRGSTDVPTIIRFYFGLL